MYGTTIPSQDKQPHLLRPYQDNRHDIGYISTKLTPEASLTSREWNTIGYLDPEKVDSSSLTEIMIIRYLQSS